MNGSTFFVLIMTVAITSLWWIWEEEEEIISTATVVAATEGSQPTTHQRPSYLIVGAGKSGTSSLYEYLSHHSSFEAATNKQVHYFKYFYKKGMSWYLQHFSDDKSKMTGESAPGYLPYPWVAKRIYQDLGREEKIIAIFRDPLTRAFSSYNYNYLPQAKKMKLEGEGGIVSFEDLISAELDWLDICLKEGGFAQNWAKKSVFMGKVEDKPEFNIIEGCYEDDSLDIFEKGMQWGELVERLGPSSKRTLNVRTKYLFQALLGRGLGSYQLAWWTGAFENIYVVCSESLLEYTSETLNALGSWMGVSEDKGSEWEEIAKIGAYNVGDNNPGGYVYDQKISWEEFNSLANKDVDYGLSEGTMNRVKNLINDDKRRLNALKKKFNFSGGGC